MTGQSSPNSRDLNFKVPPEFRQLFKAAANDLEISMKGFLILVFYFSAHPDNKAIRDVLNSRPSPKTRPLRPWVEIILDRIRKRNK
jgi:hypothetical protein